MDVIASFAEKCLWLHIIISYIIAKMSGDRPSGAGLSTLDGGGGSDNGDPGGGGPIENGKHLYCTNIVEPST